MLSRMQFSGTWRDYQAAVLAEFDASFVDNRIHVVPLERLGKLGARMLRSVFCGDFLRLLGAA